MKKSTLILFVFFLPTALIFSSCFTQKKAAESAGQPDPVEEVEAEPIPIFEDVLIEEEEPPPPPVAEEMPVPPPPPPPPPEEEIFLVVEEMPRFPGCEDLEGKDKKQKCSMDKLNEFIYNHVVYPEPAKENGVTGTVVVRFVVDLDGSLKNIDLLRDIGAGCGQEAIRVIQLMNEKGIKWIPGKQRGTPVKVNFNLPVRFKDRKQ